jgi:hypothetical protein
MHQPTPKTVLLVGHHHAIGFPRFPNFDMELVTTGHSIGYLHAPTSHAPLEGIYEINLGYRREFPALTREQLMSRGKKGDRVYAAPKPFYNKSKY